MFARLISAGHRPADIPHLTFRQIRLYHAQACARSAADRADRIEDVNLGMGGGKKLPAVLRALREP